MYGWLFKMFVVYNPVEGVFFVFISMINGVAFGGQAGIQVYRCEALVRLPLSLLQVYHCLGSSHTIASSRAHDCAQWIKQLFSSAVSKRGTKHGALNGEILQWPAQRADEWPLGSRCWRGNYLGSHKAKVDYCPQHKEKKKAAAVLRAIQQTK